MVYVTFAFSLIALACSIYRVALDWTQIKAQEKEQEAERKRKYEATLKLGEEILKDLKNRHKSCDK